MGEAPEISLGFKAFWKYGALVTFGLQAWTIINMGCRHECYGELLIFIITIINSLIYAVLLFIIALINAVRGNLNERLELGVRMTATLSLTITFFIVVIDLLK